MPNPTPQPERIEPGDWVRWKLNPHAPLVVTEINPEGWVCTKGGAYRPDEVDRIPDDELLAYCKQKLIDISTIIGWDNDIGNLLRHVSELARKP